MRAWIPLVLGAVVTASLAWADATSIKAYVAAQVPNNTTGAVTPANIRNSFNYLTDNLSTVPYTGQVVTSFSITGTTITASNKFIGDVSATNISATSFNGGLFTGDGSGLTGVLADSADWYDITNIPAPLTAVSNSTSLSMSSISVSGLLSAANVSASSNISAIKFIGDGSLLTGLVSVTPTWTAITGIPTGISNVSNSTGSVTATTFTGTNLGGTLTTAAQNLIQTMTGLTTVSVTGNVSVSTINGQTPVFGGSSISTTTFTTASNISGSTAIGYNANIGTGVDNTAYGVKAGFSFGNNGSASYNTALGASALSSATGDYNTAVGAHAFRGSTVDQNTGQGNTAIGFESLLVNSEGNSNTAIGFQTMWDNQIGSANTAIGYLALTHNIEGDNNTGLGYAALLNNADGNLNVAVGPFSLNSNISGGSNVGVGYQALTLAQADENVGVGTFALTGATGLSSGNTAVGQGALGYLDNGSYNVAIGNSAGAYLEGGSENIFIGHFTEYPISSTMSNQLNIGNTIEGYMGGDNTKLGINVVSATATLEVSGTVSASFFVGDGSQITGITHSSPSWYAVQNIPTPVQAVSNSGSITMAEVSATRLYAANISGSSIAGTLSTAAQANITSVGTLTGLTVSGVGTFGTVTATAVNGLSISGTSIAGKLITAAQPSITTVGTLSGLNVTGTVTATTFSGNVPVTSLNSGTGATSATYWRGDGSWAVPTSNIVSAAYTSSTDITSQILFDGSAPQNTEGVQIASVTITPHSTSSKIKIQFSCWGRISASGVPVATLFRDSGASAIQVATGSTYSAAGTSTINMLYVDAPATTSPVTYYLRVGVGGSYTYTINYSGYFPTSAATLVAEEI